MDEEESPHAPRTDMVPGGSLLAAYFGVIKATVGPAILYLPSGFSTAGWAAALAMLTIATSGYLYGADKLLICWRMAVREEGGEKLGGERHPLVDPGGVGDRRGGVRLGGEDRAGQRRRRRRRQQRRRT